MTFKNGGGKRCVLNRESLFRAVTYSTECPSYIRWLWTAVIHNMTGEGGVASVNEMQQLTNTNGGEKLYPACNYTVPDPPVRAMLHTWQRVPVFQTSAADSDDWPWGHRVAGVGAGGQWCTLRLHAGVLRRSADEPVPAYIRLGKLVPNIKRFKWTLIYFNTDTQYAHFRGNPLYQATKWHLNASSHSVSDFILGVGGGGGLLFELLMRDHFPWNTVLMKNRSS